MRKAIEVKSQVVSEIVEKLQKSSSAIVVDYKGLTVEEVTELRKKMREAGVEYKVYKNTLVRKAAKEVGIPFVFASYGFGNTNEYISKIEKFEDLLNL